MTINIKDNLNEEFGTCPYNCWIKWCDWTCIIKNQKNVHSINDENCFSKDIIDIIDYWEEKEQIKDELFELLWTIDLNYISWEVIMYLWKEIKYFWKIIYLYEHQVVGFYEDINIKRLNIFIKNILKNQLDKERIIIVKEKKISKSNKLKQKLKEKNNHACVFVKSFIMSLVSLSWKDIIRQWDIIEELWMKIKNLEILIKLTNI